MSNVAPQRPSFNRGIWSKLEKLTRNWAKRDRQISIATGPILKGPMETIGSNRVAVPPKFYKVILDVVGSEIKGIGFIIPNKGSKQSLRSYAVSIDTVETRTGIDFFAALPDKIENKIESSLDLNRWFKNPSKSSDRHERTNASKNKSAQKKLLKAGNIFITRTGKTYHRAGCRYLRRSRVPVSLQYARNRYRPCSVCNPPR